MEKTFEQCLIEAYKIKGAKDWLPELDNLSEQTIEAIIRKVVIELDLVQEGEVKTTPATIKRAEAFIQKWDLIADELYQAEQAAKEQAAKEENAGLSVVDEFLALWKEEAAKYYTKLREELLVERNRQHEITPESLTLIPKSPLRGGRKYSDEMIEEIMNQLNEMPSRQKEKLQSEVSFRAFNVWKAKHSKAEIAIVEMMWEDGFLNKTLDKEVNRKKIALIKRVEAKAGTIIDASGLYIGDNMEINGWVVGQEKKVYVQTIYAGGYNIQCLHYRVIVK